MRINRVETLLPGEICWKAINQTCMDLVLTPYSGLLVYVSVFYQNHTFFITYEMKCFTLNVKSEVRGLKIFNFFLN